MTKDKIEEAINLLLSHPNQVEQAGYERNQPVHGVTPLSIWTFVGLVDDSSPGDMRACPEEELDQDRYKNDMLTLQGLYADLIAESASPNDCIVRCAAAMFEEVRVKQTVGMLLAEQDMEHMEALRFIARAQQAKFVFIEDSFAVFDCTTVLDMAASMIKLRYRKREAAHRLLRLHMIAPRLEIPLDTNKGYEAAFDKAAVLEILIDIGNLVLNYVFAE
jgi:hypothetical protein